MLESAVHTVFAIPELVLQLSAHLDPQVLARCTRVCKDWLRQFEYILWSNVLLKRHHCESLSDTPASQMKATLIRNLPLIRTMRIYFANVTLLQVLAEGSATDPCTWCNSLKLFEIEDVSCEHVHRASQHLTTILNLNYRLTNLELPFELVYNDVVMASISKLDNLKRLSISSAEDCDGDQAMLLLQACLPLPNLTQLFIDLDVVWYDLDRGIIDLKAVISRASRARFSKGPSATKIQTLQLPSKFNGQHNPLPLLLLQSKLLDLESCEIPWFDENTNPTELTQVVRKHCPKLKHLICPSFRDQERDGHRVDSFILGCTQLQSFVSHHFIDHEPESEPRHIISTLASQHSETLEVLELTECHQVSSRDQQAILSRCKRLKQFWVMNSYPDETDIGIESTDVRENWVCMELTKLGLTLNRYPMMENVIGELDGAMGSALDMELWDEIGACILADADKRVYTQIGRLAKLEILALDIVVADEQTNALRGDYAWDLTLSHGWLGEMAGLKSLKSLRLEADFWSEMGQAEMEFIHEQWPSLREITLRGNVLLLGAESPWRWLLTKRPHLRLDVAQ